MYVCVCVCVWVCVLSRLLSTSHGHAMRTLDRQSQYADVESRRRTISGGSYEDTSRGIGEGPGAQYVHVFVSVISSPLEPETWNRR
uniref:Putative secreted protein n=1 Tax=Anopheles darlingi TaxID=43151 RepID=A0A2M4CLJ2_ANODA